jgi:FAD/FMN-containing dehydrogenase
VTLGGGVGRFTGMYGLMIDALASVRIVTASGEVVEASKDTNWDLFWGVLGAGANFGIITSATFNLNDLPNGGNIYTTDMIFPANQTAAFFEAVETFSGTLPAELAGIAIMSYDSTTSESEMMTNWIYVGSEADAESVLAPITALNPSYHTSEVVAWNKLINSTFNNFGALVCEAGAIRDIYSTNLKNYSASTWSAAFSKMSDFFDNYPNGRSSALQFELYPNQAMNAVSADSTAWPWRDSNGYL